MTLPAISPPQPRGVAPHSPLRVGGVLAALAVATAVLLGPLARGAPAAYDPKPWLQDLNQAQEAVATKYANLEWLIFEREIDPAALFRDARSRIEAGSSAADARAALDRLARQFGDGHVRFRWPAAQAPSEAPPAKCASLGYDRRMQGAPAAALITGYVPLASAPAQEFPAGMILLGGHKVGVLKIGAFTPQGYPSLCEAGLAALSMTSAQLCDDACADRLEAWASDRMTQDLIAQLAAIKAAGADVLLVDIADNGGGTEWAEAVARMLTAVRLKSEHARFVRGAHWAKAFAIKEAELRAAARTTKGEDRTFLTRLADQVAIRRRDAETPCASEPMWHGERPACHWLGDAFYSSGLLESASSEALRGKPWARLVFSPMAFQYPDGVWQGPLIVLVDSGTGSAAEQFAAILQDNHAAIVIGAPTAGAGCGHTDGGTPTVLANSGGVLVLPDCARLRADGSNEVMGIQPDILIGLRAQDGPHRKGLRIAQSLPEVVRGLVGNAD